MTNKNPRHEGFTAGAAGKVDHLKFTSSSLPDEARRDTPSCSFLMDAQHVPRTPLRSWAARAGRMTRTDSEIRCG
jgi:hypothetical protein